MRLIGFLQRKRKNWSQRLDFWPGEYPHRIATQADLAALQHLISSSGVLNAAAIDLLAKDEDFWWDLTRFFQQKVDKLGKIERRLITATGATIRGVPLYCWEIE